MRVLLLPLILLSGASSAQPPRPEFSVVFVHDTAGSPMPGAYATPVAAQAWRSTYKAPAWTVEMHFTVSKDYPYGAHEIGTHKSWPLSADTVRDGRREHLRFSILDGWCEDQYLLVIRGGDTMRVDMPNDATVRGHMGVLQVSRSGAVPSPEVLRFMPGHFSFVALAQDARVHAQEQRIADRLVHHARRRGKRP
jgi:hypothetical protein